MIKASVKRYCIVEVEMADLACSSPATAVLASDKIIDYDILLRQIAPQENILSVEFTGRFAGAEVDMTDDFKPSTYYEFEEDDISELKELLEKK